MEQVSYELGRFGDRRLEKGGSCCTVRWLRGAARAGQVLSAAWRITAVADRESDIYELFARRPANVELIVRAAQDRSIEDGTRLFAHIDGLAENGRVRTRIPAAPG